MAESPIPTDPPPEFLSIGHVSYDIHIAADGSRSKPEAGGAAAYTAMAANRLTEATVAIATAADSSWANRSALRVNESLRVVSEQPTVFEDRFVHGHRQQRLVSQAETIEEDLLERRLLTPGAVFACPLVHELPLDCRTWFWAEFTCLIPQGWFRKVGRNGHITLEPPDTSRIAGPWDLIVLSEQEAEVVPSLDDWKRLGRMLAVTHGEHGAVVYSEGGQTEVTAIRPRRVSDTTGAGDIWAAAFTIRYREKRDIVEAGQFAAAAAAICVSRKGLRGVPESRQEVMEMLRQVAV